MYNHSPSAHAGGPSTCSQLSPKSATKQYAQDVVFGVVVDVEATLKEEGSVLYGDNIPENIELVKVVKDVL